MEINKEEYIKQYKEDSEKEGGVIHIYLNKVTSEEIIKAVPMSPMINIKASNIITFGALIHALDEVKRAMLEKEGAMETYTLFKLITGPGEEVDLDKFAEEGKHE